MSETPLGPDWWQASDSKWYPPPRPEVPTEQPQTPTGETQAPSGEQPGMAVDSPGEPLGGHPPQPYGGPPISPPGGPYPPPGPYPPGAGAPGPNRNLVLALAGGAAVVLVILGFLAFNGDSGSDDTTATATTDTTEPAPDTTETEPVDPPPETTIAEPDGPTEGGEAFPGDYVDEPLELGDDLVVLEYGFSTVEESLQMGDDLMVTFGMILENQGSEFRSQLELVLSLYDEDDNLMSTGELTVHTIQPGETLGVGVLGEDIGRTPDPVTAPIARVEIIYGGESPYYEAGEGTIETGDVTFEEGNNGALEVRFEAESSYDYDLNSPRSNVIFRNAAGEIVGGNSHPTPDYLPVGGGNRGEILSFATFTGLDVDPDESEVYVESGYEHPS